LCKSTAIIDEETDRDRTILFNSNTFRDGQYARKTFLVLEQLKNDEKARLSEVQDKLAKGSALDIPAPEHEESAKDDPRVSRGAMVEGPA
jgi:hypothetical protein